MCIQTNTKMKIFIIALLFVLALFFPILFVPLLALTLVLSFYLVPHVYHEMWPEKNKPSG